MKKHTYIHTGEFENMSAEFLNKKRKNFKALINLLNRDLNKLKTDKCFFYNIHGSEA